MRRRLAALLTAAMTLTLAAFLVPLAVLVQRSAQSRATGGAIVVAQTMAVLAAGDRSVLKRTVLQNNEGTSPYPVTVYLPDGVIYGDGTEIPAVAVARLRTSSFVAQGAGGWDVVLAVAGVPVDANGGTGVAVIRAFVSDAELGRGVHRAWIMLAVLGGFLLVLAVATGDLLTRSVIRPIREVAEVSHRLAAGELTARSRLSGPDEVRAVAAGLNHLAGRIQELLRQERESVADISHQLRTPLTALRLEVDTTPGAAGLAPHVAALEQAVTRVIEQARAAGHTGPAACDATAVLAQRCEFWGALAEDRRRVMRADLPRGPVPVGVPETDLRACVDALLGNVFAHTPEGTWFTVALHPRPGGWARLVVDDGGPGLPGPQALRRGSSTAGSTGLGLDIARGTAEASGGALRLGTAPGGGARVTLDFGPPQR